MKLCDMHTHSDNSFDAKSTVDELCQAALDKGLYAIAVTDHCEAEYICLGENCEFGSFDRQIPLTIEVITQITSKRLTISVTTRLALYLPLNSDKNHFLLSTI